MTCVQIQNRLLCAHAIWRKTVLSGLWVNGHRYVLVVVYREKKRFLKWFRLSKGKLASEAEPITVPGELNIDRLSMRKVEGTVQELLIFLRRIILSIWISKNVDFNHFFASFFSPITKLREGVWLVDRMLFSRLHLTGAEAVYSAIMCNDCVDFEQSFEQALNVL